MHYNLGGETTADDVLCSFPWKEVGQKAEVKFLATEFTGDRILSSDVCRSDNCERHWLVGKEGLNSQWVGTSC